jgi:hypothetical protein
MTLTKIALKSRRSSDSVSGKSTSFNDINNLQGKRPNENVTATTADVLIKSYLDIGSWGWRRAARHAGLRCWMAQLAFLINPWVRNIIIRAFFPKVFDTSVKQASH